MPNSATDFASHARRGNWIETAGKAGHVAKGCIYIVIGVLATMAAIGAGGQTSGSQGAIYTIGSQPFGRILLAMLAIGLLGYVVWRLFEAIADPDGKGNDAKGIGARASYFVSGLGYLGLALLAGSIALRVGAGGGGGDSKQEWTAKLLSMPFGQWLVGLVGAVVIGVALFNLYLAVSQKFMDRYNKREMTDRARKVAKSAGVFGLASRAVTFGIIGGFLIAAAYQADASETTGLSGALQTVAQQPYGPWLLAVVALGMVAFGVHCFVAARFRHFPGLHALS